MPYAEWLCFVLRSKPLLVSLILLMSLALSVLSLVSVTPVYSGSKKCTPPLCSNNLPPPPLVVTCVNAYQIANACGPGVEQCNTPSCPFEVIVTFGGKPISGAVIQFVVDGQAWKGCTITSGASWVGCDTNTYVDTPGLHYWYATASAPPFFSPGTSPTYWWNRGPCTSASCP
jgi:hypothetical protein